MFDYAKIKCLQPFSMYWRLNVCVLKQWYRVVRRTIPLKWVRGTGDSGCHPVPHYTHLVYLRHMWHPYTFFDSTKPLADENIITIRSDETGPFSMKVENFNERRCVFSRFSFGSITRQSWYVNIVLVILLILGFSMCLLTEGNRLR